MKKVFIVHGWDSSPDEPLLKWLKKELEKKNFSVTAFKMPNPSEPKIDEWVSFLQKKIPKPDEDTFIVAHSIGCQALLRFFSLLAPEEKVGGVVLIAPWTKLQNLEMPEDISIVKPWLEIPIPWERVADQTSKFVAIFSANDPFVPLSEKEIFRKKLGAKIIVESDKGHFTGQDGVTELASALVELLEMSN